MSRRPTRLATVAVVAATAVLALGATSAAERGGSGDAGLRAVRAWTERYHSEAEVQASGFTPTEVCVPAMGYHYVDFSRVDDRLEPSRPEVLLFAPAPGGGRVLVGAEWMVVDRDQDLATDDDRPSLFGHPFEGPMPGHGPGMPVHYDLHAWAWVDNPAGGFAPWNSAVDCGP